MIYLDYAATTPISAFVQKKMDTLFLDAWANPSSAHTLGRQALAAIDNARKTIATYFSVSSSAIIFTSSGTESIHLALYSATQTYLLQHKKPGILLYSALEHKAVLEQLDAYKLIGWQLVQIPITQNGTIDLVQFGKLLTKEVAIVTVQWVNSEFGTVQDIQAVSALTKAAGIHFHCDAMQGVAHLPVPTVLPDYMTIAPHKFFGPKGIAALIAPLQSPILPVLRGGGQEFGMRSGTENTHAIIGFAAAVEELTTQLHAREQHLQSLENFFITQVSSMKKITCVPNSTAKVHGILSFRIPTMSAEDIVMQADLAGFCISAGSACNIGSVTSSSAALALGYSKQEAKELVRISFAEYTSKKDIEDFINFLKML